MGPAAAWVRRRDEGAAAAAGGWAEKEETPQLEASSASPCGSGPRSVGCRNPKP
jgi:hypothetical protein